jgi:hypothetical protein
MKNINLNSQFVAGFISAFLLLAGVALLSQAAAWFRMNPQPRAFFDFLNTPLFSILDLFTGLFGLLVLFVLITAPAWAPRP